MDKIEPVLIKSFLLLNEYFQKEHYRYCLIGGIAAGYWGEPRYTKDMDFTVVSRTHSVKEIIAKLKKDGFKARANGEGQIQIVEKDDLTFEADLILAETDYQDWVVQRARSVPIFARNVPICSPEDLIILKLIANRRQDLLDIENVLKRNARNLDRGYLKKWLAFWELEKRFADEFGGQ